MKSEWEIINLNFTPYKDTEVQILCSVDDVQVLLDDHIVKTTTMKNSPFVKPFEREINNWDHRLVSDYLFLSDHCDQHCFFDSNNK